MKMHLHNISKVALILLFTFNFQLFTFNSFAQSPQSFQYQAVVRDASGNVLQSVSVNFKLSIILGPLPGVVEYVETHTSITTNTFGIATLAVGSGTPVTNLFTDIDWSASPRLLKVEANLGSGYINMGTTQLLSVPYALYAESSGDSLWNKNGANIYNTNPGNVGVGLNNPTGRMVVQGSLTASDTLPLFEVKNKTGQTIFVVYPDSVHVFVKDIGSKSNQGGFAVSGRNNSKAITNDYLRVTPDSTRIWTGDTLKGFGVKNIGSTSKTTYMQLTPSNYFIGHEAGKSITTGKYNSFIGYQSGYSDTSGNKNYFIGYRSGFSNTNGYSNIFIGDSTGFINTSGSYNIFLGNQCGYSNSTGSNNLFTGTLAGYSNTTGYLNVGIGNNAMFANTTGISNTALGYSALHSNVTNNGNTAIGKMALTYNQGDYNTALGLSAFAMFGSTTYANSTAIGYAVGITSSNQVRIGNTSVTSSRVQVDWTIGSDARIKNNIQENVSGLAFVKELRPVTYYYDIDKENEIIGVKDTSKWEGKYDIEKMQFSGFIAQEVDAAANKVGYNFSGVDKSGKIWGLRYASFTVPLVKAVQEQQKQIEQLKLEIEQLKAIINKN